MKKWIISMIIMYMLVLTTFQFNSSPVSLVQKKTITSTKEIAVFVQHDPIVILNDSAFESYGFPGSGTSTSPYLIDNYNITDSSRDLIHIENTKSYFRISNCFLNSNYSTFNCTTLINVTYGTFNSNIITNTTNVGINLYNSSNNNIWNNEIHNCEIAGINLLNSSNNIVSDNTVYYCNGTYGTSIYGSGIILVYSEHNSISNNNIHDCSGIHGLGSIYGIGIALLYSTNSNTISNNIIHNVLSGICSGLSDSNTIYGNTVSNCDWWSIYVSWGNYNNISYNTVNKSEYGISIDTSSNNSALFSNTIYNCSDRGIEINYNCHNTKAWNNNVYNCSCGISLDGCNKSTLQGNSIINCSNSGITMYDSNNNSIKYNLFNNNTDYGIGVWSLTNNNIITYNNFINNNISGTTQAYDSGSNNEFSNNYWHDYSGFGNYSLDGISNTNDTTPLIDPIPPNVSIINPLPKYYRVGTISVIFSGSALNYRYYIETVDNQNQTWNINEKRKLPEGIYTLHVYGDVLTVTTYKSVEFTIDTTAPIVIISNPIDTIYSQNGVRLVYTVSDGTVSIHINGVINDLPLYSGTLISNLQDGSYNFTVISVDQAGNIGRDTVIFVIDTVAPSIDIISPINTTYDQKNVTLSYTVSDGITFIYINDIANISVLPSGTLISNLMNETNNITIVAVDQVGNIGKDTVIFTIEATDNTTSSNAGYFPGVTTVLLFFIAFVVVISRLKKR